MNKLKTTRIYGDLTVDLQTTLAKLELSDLTGSQLVFRATNPLNSPRLNGSTGKLMLSEDGGNESRVLTEAYADTKYIKSLAGYATEAYVDAEIDTIELKPGPPGEDGKDGVDGTPGQAATLVY